MFKPEIPVGPDLGIAALFSCCIQSPNPGTRRSLIGILGFKASLELPGANCFQKGIINTYSL